MIDFPFFETLFAKGLQTDETIELRAVSPRKGEEALTRREFVTTIPSIDNFALRYGATHNIYFGVCTRLHGIPTRAFALWADIDGFTPESVSASYLGAYPIPATFIVSSGNGTHLYWCLDNTSTDLDEVEKSVSDIAKALGSDATVYDRARMMRVPGTLNHKSATPKGTAVLVNNAGLHWALSDLHATAHIPSDVLNLINTGTSRGYKSRSERDWRVLKQLAEVGISDAVVEFIFLNNKIGEKVSERGGEYYLRHSINRAREQAEKEANRSPWGIEEVDGQYVIDGEVVSTFVFNPAMLLVTESEDVLCGGIQAAGYNWDGVMLPRSAFTRTDALLRNLPKAAWQWLGNDHDARLLLPYFMDKVRDLGLPKKKGTYQMGRHGDLWVTPDVLIKADSVVGRDAAELVYIPTKNEAPLVTVEAVEQAEITSIVNDMIKYLPALNTPDVVWQMLGWFFGTFLKPALFEREGARFPIMNLTGTRGAGKTSLIQLFLRLAGYAKPISFDCNTTNFVLLSLMGSTTSTPISLAEYRVSTLRDPQRILRYILLSYDQSKDMRGRPDQTTVSYPLTAPLIIDGEEPITDAAALERVITLLVHPETIKEGTVAAHCFNSLTELRLQRLVLSIIQHALSFDVTAAWQEATALIAECIPESVPLRVRNNVTVVTCGLLHANSYALKMTGHMFLPKINAETLREIFVQVDTTRDKHSQMLGSMVDLGAGRTRLLADDLIEDALNAAAMHSQTGGPAPFVYKTELPKTIWLHLSSTLNWWVTQRRLRGMPSMDRSALRTQLHEREGGTTSGQYVLGYRTSSVGGQAWHMTGIDVTQCVSLGLDVPTTLVEAFGVHVVGMGRKAAA
jgi:hypothetical protein